MLRELVMERLIVAADEIFGLFENTIASYEEQLCRAREEGEQHRRQLEAVCKTQTVIRVEDVEMLIGLEKEIPPQPQWGSSNLEQAIPPSPHAKEEDTQAPQFKEEDENAKHPRLKEEEKEADVSTSPLPAVFVESEHGGPPELVQLLHHHHHHGISGERRSHADFEDVEEAIGHQEELAPWAHGGSSSLEEAVLQPPHMKEEDEDVKDPHIKEEEEANLSQLRPTAVSVENANSNEPECSQLHHHSPEGDHFGGPPPVNLLAPLSHSDDTDEPLRSNADSEGDDKQPNCAEKATLQKKPFQKRRSQPRKKCFSCSICGKAFAQNRLMIEHKRTHKDMSQIEKHMRTPTGEKHFNCSVCSRTFTQKGHLKRHMSTHRSENPIKCSLCDKTFLYRSELVMHMRKHTGEKSFSCPFCDRAFPYESQLIRHMRTHTGEKPFTCSLCEKTFVRKSHLGRHMRTHTGERPFSCSFCGRAFKRNDHLLAHEHTHMRPFTCTAVACGKRFALESALVKHMLTHRY